MSEKSSKNLQQKRQIAQYAASLVEEGDSIYLDAGSTVTEMIPFLPAKEIVVVTNGLMHINALLERNIKTFLIGGFAKEQTKAIIGRGHWRAWKIIDLINALWGLTASILNSATPHRIRMRQ